MLRPSHVERKGHTSPQSRPAWISRLVIAIGFGLPALGGASLALFGIEPQVARAAEKEAADGGSPAAREESFRALADEVTLLEKQSNVLKKVIRLIRPMVVHIEAEKVDATSLRNGRRGEIKEAGSGFIIMMGHNYYVVTNCHVVNRAATRDIKIRLDDGREIHPLKVLTDKETDVAIMSIAAPNLIPSRLGNSDDLEIGDFVLAVGSPFGLSHSVTFGIISAERRRDLELDSDVKYQDFLQTDAAIN
ncbi:MAG TPA: trypsin-like peptidase domain-containing protein, partial [Planctomycetaceae bacterium]